MEVHGTASGGRRWLKFVNTDGSGKDSFANVDAIRGIVIDDPVAPSITVYAGLSTPTRKGNSTELRDMYAELTGAEAQELIDYLERNKAMTIQASWTTRPDPPPT